MKVREFSTAPSLSCDGCPIRHRAICATCDSDELAALDRMKSYRKFSAGQPILAMDQPMHFVASVVSGSATLSQTMADGRVQMTGLLLPSDFLGRPDRSTIAHDVTAVDDVVLCCFERRSFAKLLNETPHVAQRLLVMTLDELDVAREWMLLLGRKTARERVASALFMLSRRAKALGGGPINSAVNGKASGVFFDMPLTRETLANYLGLTIETVSRQMSALRQDGVIALTGSRMVSIPSLPDLVAETGDEAAEEFII